MTGLSVTNEHPAGSPLVTVSLSIVSATASVLWDAKPVSVCRNGKDNKRQDFDIHDDHSTRRNHLPLIRP